jgi:glycine betaine/proline transport system ATP-binding protein
MQMQVSVPLDSTRRFVDAERSSSRLAVRGFAKMFGPDPPTALDMLPDCADWDEVHRKLGAAVGVDNASFEVKSGEVVMIMGRSGPD